MALTWIGKTVGKVPSKNEVSVTLNKNGECKFIGDYDLLWDNEEKLNYIDVTKRIPVKR